MLSDGSMHGHDEVEAVLDALQQESAVVDIDVELSLEGIVHEHAGLDVDVVVLTVPVGLEGNGHTVPSLGVGVAETVTHTLDDSLGQDMGL